MDKSENQKQPRSGPAGQQTGRSDNPGRQGKAAGQDRTALDELDDLLNNEGDVAPKSRDTASFASREQKRIKEPGLKAAQDSGRQETQDSVIDLAAGANSMTAKEFRAVGEGNMAENSTDARQDESGDDDLFDLVGDGFSGSTAENPSPEANLSQQVAEPVNDSAQSSIPIEDLHDARDSKPVSVDAASGKSSAPAEASELDPGQPDSSQVRPDSALDEHNASDLDVKFDSNEAVKGPSDPATREESGGYEEEFLAILNEEKVRAKGSETDSAAARTDDSKTLLEDMDSDLDVTELAIQEALSPPKLESGDVAQIYEEVIALETPQQTPVQRNSDDRPSYQRENKQTSDNESVTKSHGKKSSKTRKFAPEKLQVDLTEDESMKWLAIGIPTLLFIIVMIMGGYLFSLQSQIDELHLLLPLDQENVFGGESDGVSAPNNDAVIENINARIDNLADTLELIANSDQSGAGNRSSASLDGSGSDQAGVRNSNSDQAAALGANEAEIRKLKSRLDVFSRSLQSISGTVDQHASKIDELTRIAKFAGIPGGGRKKQPPQSPTPSSTRRKSTQITESPVGRKAGSAASGTKKPVTKAAKTKSTPPASAVAVKAKSAAPASVVSKKGPWSVNLMSLNDKAAANKQLDNFRKRGVRAGIERTQVSGKTWYRIQVQGFATKRQAQRFAASAKKKLGLSSTWVTR